MKLLSVGVMLICLSGLVYAEQPFNPFNGAGSISIQGDNGVFTVKITGMKLADAFKDLGNNAQTE